MLDVVTRGRLIAAFVGGWAGVLLLSISIRRISREKFREALDLIVRRGRSRGPGSCGSKHYHLPLCQSLASPLQKPHPPIWIPQQVALRRSSSSPSGAIPMCWCLHAGSVRKTAAAASRRTEEFHTKPPVTTGYAPGTYVWDDEQRAKDEAAEHGQFFMTKAFKIPRTF